MKFLSEYQKVMESLIQSTISFTVNVEDEILEIADDIYIDIEENWDDEPVSFVVGSRLRETSFDINDINSVLDFVIQELE